MKNRGKLGTVLLCCMTIIGGCVVAPAALQEAAASMTDKIEIPQIEAEERELPDNEALQFVREMKLGWCLGNTFDAYTDNELSDEMKLETMWSKAETTHELLVSVKEEGFETIRIPVSWHNHVDEDYNISEAWMARVEEVVRDALDCGLHVILNIHHDNSTDYMYPDSEHLEQSKQYVTAIWTQIAERFADCDEMLIFESLNEPRLIGSQYEWWLNSSAKECQDAVACINELNQVFVDTVRATGGNNADRYLMVPGYDASIDGATCEGFALPEDTADNRIIVSVHAYTPYNFALQSPDESGSINTFDLDSAASTKDIDDLMDRLYETWTSQGIPVVIGEFGARNKDNNLQDRVDWAAYYVANARAIGVSCCWWDNNAFVGDGENFGLLSRILLKWRFGDIIDAMMQYAE